MSSNWIRCLCLLVLVLLVVTEAKFGRNKKADRNGRVHFHGRQSQGSRSLDLNYNATLKVNPDDVIDLDDIRPASVECYSSSVVVVFTDASVSNSFREVNETKSPLNWRAGDIIVGGSENGCAMDNAPHDLMRRITRLTRFNSRYVLQTVAVDLKDVFSELNGRLEVIRTEITRQEPVFRSRDTSTPQEVQILPDSMVTSKKRATTDPITLLSPLKRQNFLATNLTVSFIPNFNGTVSFNIYRDVSFSSDPLLYSRTGLSVVANQVMEFQFSTQSITASPYYYIEFVRGGSIIFSLRYFSINYPEHGYFTKPAPTSEYYLGSNLNVSFLITDNVNSVTVEVYRNVEFGLDDKRSSLTYSIVPSQRRDISISIGYDWPESNNYYVAINWDCTFGFCDSAVSDYFTVRRTPTNSSITFKSPISSNVFTNGENITLAWLSDQPVSDGTVYLKQDRVGADPVRLQLRLKEFANGSLYIVIPVNSAWPPSSSYYFEMRYNCLSSEMCDIVQTPRFSIAFRPIVQFISPPAKKRYSVNDILPLQWSTSKSSAFVSLVVDYPIYVPFVSTLWEQQLNLQAYQTLTIIPNMASSFPVHLEVAYDCAFMNFYCTIERGPQFFITQTYTGDYNYNAVTGKAEDVINIFKENCTSLGYEENATCNDGDFLSYVCEFCSAGGELSISLDCDNCWVKTEVTLSVITFSLESISLDLYSDFDLNLDLLLNVTGRYAKQSSEIPLATGIPIFAYTLDLYLFKAELGLVGAVYFKYQYTVEATGTVAMGFDVSVPFHLQVDSNNVTEAKPELIFNRHGPDILIVGGVTGRAELIFELKLTALGKLEFRVRFIPFATLDGSFQIPPFDALPAPGYIVPESEYHIGDCTMKHLFQYEIDVGLDVGINITAFSKHLWGNTYSVVDPYPFVSGCLLQVVRFEVMCFEFIKTPTQLNLGQDSFVTFFVQDLISGVDSRFTFDQFFKFTFDIDAATTEVCLLVLEKNGLTIEQIISEITNEISNDDSDLFDTRLSRVSPYLIRPAAPVPVIPPLADTPILPPIMDAPVTPPIEEPVSIPIATPETEAPISVPVQDAPVSFDPPTLVPSTIDVPIAVPINDQVPVGTDTPITMIAPVAEPSIMPIESPIASPISDQDPPTAAPQTVNVPLSESPSIDTPAIPMTEPSPTATPLTAPVSEPVSSPIDVPINAPTVIDDTPVASPDVHPIASPIVDSPPSSPDAPTAVPSSDAPITVDAPTSSAPITPPITVPISSPVSAPVGNQPVNAPVMQPTSVPVIQSTPVPVTTPPVQSPVPIGNNVPTVQVPPVASPLSNNQSPNSAPKVEDAKGQISRGTNMYASTLIYTVLVIVANLL